MSDSSCIFCKIVEGKIPSTKIFESESVLGFKDLQPLAKIHYLFIHKRHSRDMNHMMSMDPTQVSEVYAAIKEVTEKEGLAQQGFRVVNNVGAHGGQTVFHTHFHLLGGEPLGRFGR
jgi:histidine triad (HIT) family protein